MVWLVRKGDRQGSVPLTFLLRVVLLALDDIGIADLKAVDDHAQSHHEMAH